MANILTGSYQVFVFRGYDRSRFAPQTLPQRPQRRIFASVTQTASVELVGHFSPRFDFRLRRGRRNLLALDRLQIFRHQFQQSVLFRFGELDFAHDAFSSHRVDRKLKTSRPPSDIGTERSRTTTRIEISDQQQVTARTFGRDIQTNELFVYCYRRRAWWFINNGSRPRYRTIKNRTGSKRVIVFYWRSHWLVGRRGIFITDTQVSDTYYHILYYLVLSTYLLTVL